MDNMGTGHERKKGATEQTIEKTPYWGKARLALLSMFLLFGLLASLSQASALPANVYIQNSTTNPAITFPSLSGLPSCTANTMGGTCTGTDTIAGTNTLTGNLYVIGNIVITSGSTLTSNGFYMSATLTFNSMGATINSGVSASNLGTGGAGGASGIAGNPGVSGGSIIKSYGGSGAGGGAGASGADSGWHSGGAGGNGGNTISNAGVGAPAPGAGGSGSGTGGGTPSIPTLTLANAINYCSNINTYLSGTSGGGGGGGGGGNGGTGGTGGSSGPGAAGVCISANTLRLGTINANGVVGTAGAGYNGGYAGGGGGAGGSGGGVILLANGIGGYTAGTYNINGGSGGGGGGSSGSVYSSGGNGGTGGNGQVVRYMSSTGTTILPVIVNQVYPLLFYTSDPTVSYTLNSVVGATQTVLQAGNAISYVPPSNQPTGIYNYSIVEYNGVSQATMPINLSVSMTDIVSPLTFTGSCSNPIKYVTNCANVPTWGATPSSWGILGGIFPMLNTTGTPNIDDFSNQSQSFYPKIQLTYNSFNPAIVFVQNALNNPAVTNIIQAPWTWTLSNTIYPTNRIIGNFSIFSQYTFNAIPTSLSVAINASVNGYTSNATLTASTGNSLYFLQTPNSIYNNNPSITYAINDSAMTSNYYSHTDTFCAVTSNLTNPTAFFPIGMVDTNGSKYSFYVYTAGGGSAQGYIMEVLEQKGVGSVQVQSYLIPGTLPFVLALEATGQNYAYDVYSRNCKDIYYKGAFTTPSISVYITLNNTNSGFVLNVTNANGKCRIYATVANTYKVSCYAGDSSNNAYEYKDAIYLISSAFGGTTLVHNYTAIGSSFIDNFTLPVGQQYVGDIYAYVYKTYDPTFLIFGAPLNVVQAPIAAPLLGLIALCVMLVAVLGGASTGKVTIMMMLVDAGMLIIGYPILNLVQVPLTVEVVFLVITVIICWYDRK